MSDNNNPCCVQVKCSIIPAIAKLRRLLPNVTLTTMFPSSSLAIHKLPSTILCSDLMASDKFFDAIQVK
jgi:hypothetical protein